jgi:hypothetical protein
MVKFPNRRKSIAFASMALLGATLLGTIFTAQIPHEVCTHFTRALDSTATSGETWVFVDVDETLIRDGSDSVSFEKTGTFEQIKKVNEPLIQELCKFRNHPSIKLVALTSAINHGFSGVSEQTSQIDIVPFLLSKAIPVPLSKIRADAMESLGLPFAASFGPNIHKLPFVMQEIHLSDEIISELRPISLSPELEQESFFSGLSLFQRVHRVSPTRLQYDFYVKDPIDELRGQQMGYAKILACPVYENGVIFSNFLNYEDGWQKGLVMRSFLFAKAKDPSQWPASIIAIDDNFSMLQNMQQVCFELDIAFIGIHFSPPRVWIFGVPPSAKK